MVEQHSRSARQLPLLRNWQGITCPGEQEHKPLGLGPKAGKHVHRTSCNAGKLGNSQELCQIFLEKRIVEDTQANLDKLIVRLGGWNGGNRDAT